jgi:hypothetical protein
MTAAFGGGERSIRGLFGLTPELRRCEKMPGHRECLKANPHFPKDCDDFVRHIMLEANCFTPSQRRRASEQQID